VIGLEIDGVAGGVFVTRPRDFPLTFELTLMGYFSSCFRALFLAQQARQLSGIRCDLPRLFAEQNAGLRTIAFSSVRPWLAELFRRRGEPRIQF
jgi:hypothetical protein